MENVKNILVVGGAGYIGSHTVLALKDAGFGVVVFDNFSTGHRDACFGDVTIEGDLSDANLLRRVLKDYDIDCVVHFAALIEAGISVKDPLPFFRTNVPLLAVMLFNAFLSVAFCVGFHAATSMTR